MMRNLCLEEGETVQMDNVSLSVATYAKFQPQSVEFLDITNPKAVLENALRNFACLTQGDVVAIKYNDKEYELCVLEIKPGTAVSIIECDMNVDFAAPVGYKEPERPKPMDQSDAFQEPQEMEEEEPQTFVPFAGSGNRLDGKKKSSNSESSSGVPVTSSVPTQQRRGIPNYNYKRGTITFIRHVKPAAGVGGEEDGEGNFEAFLVLAKHSKRKRDGDLWVYLGEAGVLHGEGRVEEEDF